jgi:AraC-like DNA-binding protein
MLACDHAGFTEASAPRRLLLPATASVPLVLKIRDSAHRPPAFVHGVHETFVALEGACAPSYLEVRLAPLAAYTLLNVPMNLLNGHIVDVRDLFGAEGRLLADKIQDARDWDRRFEIIDGFLLRRLHEGPRPSAAVRQAWHRLIASGGTASIGPIAVEAGWSHKHLITKFKEQIGLTPKTAARLIRFQRLLGRLEHSPPPRWTQLAADCGYADQAHLIREFREFTGTTPTEFLNQARASGRIGCDT